MKTTIPTEASVNEPIQIHEIAKDAGRLGRDIASMLSGTLVDLEKVIEQVVMATIAGGHVLLEFVPGKRPLLKK